MFAELNIGLVEQPTYASMFDPDDKISGGYICICTALQKKIKTQRRMEEISDVTGIRRSSNENKIHKPLNRR